MSFELGAVVPGYMLRPASGIADARVAHLLVGDDGQTLGLVRSFADPTLLYAVNVVDGVAREPTAVGGHRWFRELDGVVRPVPEPAGSGRPRRTRVRRVLERLRIVAAAEQD